MAKNAGVVAIVADGMVRDIDGLEAVNIPIFALGLSPNSPQKNGPGRIGFAVAIGGSVIDQGDLVLGDRNGLCVVKRSSVDAVLSALEKVRVKEKGMDAAVAGGAKLPDWLPAYLDEHPPIVVD